MKDGYHQVPLKKEHRNLTCMTTPRCGMMWWVLVIGLKNGNAIFQRVMEEVLMDLDFADPMWMMSSSVPQGTVRRT